MSELALLGVLTASLLGSLHCVGMCGGLVAAYVGAGPGHVEFKAHGLYSVGRLLAYLALGGAAGQIGALVDLAGRLAGAQRVASSIAGVVILIWGGCALAIACGLRVPRLHGPRAVQRWLFRALAGVAALAPRRRALLVGLLSALLPCGWLYAFVASSAGTGSALAGALVMGTFWLGTVPSLMLTGATWSLVSAPLRRSMPVASAVLLIVLGLLAVSGRARLDLPLVVSDSNRSAPSCHVQR